MGGTVELAVATLHGEDETMAAFDCVIIVSTPNEAPGSSILVHERSLASAWHFVGASTAEETALIPSSPIWLLLSRSSVSDPSDPLAIAAEKACIPSLPIRLLPSQSCFRLASDPMGTEY